MENLAFTTLVILLLAVPGYVYRTVYFSQDFSKEAAPMSMTEEVYLSILFSLPFHAIAFLTIDRLYTSSIISTYVDLNIVIGALTGQYAEDAQNGRLSLADNVYRYFRWILLYLIVMTAGAAWIGHMFRKIVWRLKLDVKLPSFFRYRNQWLYTFTGRDKESKERLFGVVDAICLLGGEKTRIYRGVVFGFESNEAGDLEQVQLGLAYRGKFKETKKELNSPEIKTGFYWEEVPGSILVLKYNNVLSLNVTYIPESSFNANSPSFLIADRSDQPSSQTGSAPVPASPDPAPSQSVESSRKLPE